MSNSTAWQHIYERSSFGNKYARSYLVSLFHERVKPELLKHKVLEEINVLDFGCSLGANSKIFKDMNVNIYGIDISEKAVKECIMGGIGDDFHFKAANLLNPDITLTSLFGNVKFDFIIASECMYYFKNSERRLLIDKFIDAMEDHGIFFVSTPTYECSLYREFKDIGKDENGMVDIDKSGSIKEKLSVNLPYDISEMKRMYEPFRVMDVLITDEQMYSGIHEIEYNMLAHK